jgi:selenocysteine lyase/cysteine desulfurase
VIDVDRLRADTPGTRYVTHLNNAGAALMPTPVTEAVIDYLEHESRFGGYETEAALRDRIDDAYLAIGDLLGVDPSRVSMADNATRAWDIAFYSLDLGPGDRIITTTTEYSSNLAAYFHLRDTRGVVVDVIPNTATGELDPDALSSMLDGSVKLISVNHVPTNSGTVEPVAEVGRIARGHGVPFLLDACQSVGQMPVDVEEIGCDMLSATSRKFLRGPRGVGFLWVRDEMAERLHPPFVELESAEVGPNDYELVGDRRRFETWEKNYAGIAGLGVAVRYAIDTGIDDIWDRIRKLADRLRAGLSELPEVTVHDVGTVLGGIVTFSVEGRPAGDLVRELGDDLIHVSVSSRLASPIDGDRRDLPDLVRASVHAYNTDDEVDLLVSWVASRTAG